LIVLYTVKLNWKKKWTLRRLSLNYNSGNTSSSVTSTWFLDFLISLKKICYSILSKGCLTHSRRYDPPAGHTIEWLTHCLSKKWNISVVLSSTSFILLPLIKEYSYVVFMKETLFETTLKYHNCLELRNKFSTSYKKKYSDRCEWVKEIKRLFSS